MADEESEQARRRRPAARPSAGPLPAGRNRVAGQRARPRPELDGESDLLGPNEVEAADEPVDTEQHQRRRPSLRLPRLGRGRNLGRLPVVISAVLIVVFVVTAGVLGLRLYRGRAAATSSAEVLKIVPRYASQVLSFDYRRLDSNSAAARPLLSGAYRKDYEQSMTSHAAAWKKYHYVVKSKIASAGVSQSSGSRVVVVAFVDQSVSAGTKKSGTAQDLIRLRFTMQRQHGSWLLTKLDSL
jgi:Mce-associated membrane protein